MCVQKSAVTVAEMARMVGLSRARFYQLIGSAFPYPIYDVATKRPFFPPELQEQCLDVRRRNLGIGGKPVLFHRRGRDVALPSPKKRSRSKVPDDSRCREMVAGLRSLGLAGVTAEQVQAAMKELGVSGNGSETLKAVFLHIKQRQDISEERPGTTP
jgi:hypothetical protein